jgi:hypothetical protein
VIAYTDKLSWYVARSSAMVAWVVITVAMLWGLILSSKAVRRRGVPAWLLGLHRYLGTLSIVFVGLHLLGLVGDNWVHYGWRELFVPMASRYRPGAVAWGIVGLYVLAAIQISSWLKNRLPRWFWHGVHLTSFPMFGIATLHALQSGTDVGNRVVHWGGLVGIAMVITLALFRVAWRGRRPPRRRLTLVRTRTGQAHVPDGGDALVGAISARR